MTFKSPDYQEHMVPYIVQIRSDLVQRNIKLKKEHYPLLGFLAIAGAKTEHIDQMTALYEEVIKMKIFRWYKTFAFSTALQKVLPELANLEESFDMSVVNNLEMLMQAEQAIIATTTIATVAASSNTSGGE